MRNRVEGVASRVRTALAGLRHRAGDAVVRGSAAPVAGMVEEFTRGRVVGWLSVPAGSGPVRVDLVVDDFVVSSTYATPEHAEAVAAGKEPVLPRRAVPGPGGGARHSDGEVRTFSFRIRGLWPYVRRANRIRLVVGDQPLPIHRHGLFLRPPQRGAHGLDALRARFAEGHLLDQVGHVSLDRTLDTPWQESVMRLYTRVRRVLHDELGLDAFLVYGTLLGAVREGGPIGHDFDFDAAYLSAHRRGPDAAAELEEVALRLVHHGFAVECLARALHIVDPDDPDHRIDLFHCYFDEQGEIAFPFGIAGTSRFTLADWQGLEPMQFLGEEVLVPVGADRLVAHLYGEDWRSPKPGFNWDLDRTRWAPEGHLSVEQQTRVHWANFYSRVHLNGGSTFSRFVGERSDVPRHLVDLGCGDGRDACALGAAGHVVLGLDASPEGVERGGEHAAEQGLEDRVSFATCDVGDGAALTRQLDDFRSAADGPVGFYLRFFLHAIPEEAQQELLGAIDAVARPGDQLFAEFRTLADKAGQKQHGKHYRRFIDADAFRTELETRHGFTVDYFTEGRGLSPHGDEDPVLCRVVARRTAP